MCVNQEYTTKQSTLWVLTLQRGSRALTEYTQKYRGHLVKNHLITTELEFHSYLQQVDRKAALGVLDMK